MNTTRTLEVFKSALAQEIAEYEAEGLTAEDVDGVMLATVDVCKKAGLSRAQGLKALKALAEDGIIIQTGKEKAYLWIFKG